MKHTARTATRKAAAQATPQLAQAALQAAPRKAAPAAWYASPRSLAEARPLSEPEPGSSAWLAEQRNARELRELAEVAKGSWAQPGTRAVYNDGLDEWDVTVTRRYVEDGEHMAEVEMTDGSDFGDWERLDVFVLDLRPLR